MWLYTWKGILFSPKKEGNSDTCYNIDEPWEHYAKWSKLVTKGQMLCDSTFWGTQSSQIHRDGMQNGGCQGLRGEGSGKILFNGYRVSVWDDEKVLEVDSGGGCTTMWLYLMPLNCTFKNG